MKHPSLILASLMVAAAARGQAPLDRALEEIAAIHHFQQAAISPDGSLVAYVGTLAAPRKSVIYIASLQSPSAPRIRISEGDGKTSHDEHGLAWSPDSKQIAFLSDREKEDQLQLYVAPATG